MLSIATLNSRIKFDKTDIPFAQREIMGDATETGLSRFAGRYVEDYDAYIKMYPKIFEVPFNSTNKWALTLVSPSRVSWPNNFVCVEGNNTDVCVRRRSTKSTTPEF